ncbi:MAG TPA: hypothetical protein VGL99_34395 [Chloroflexota bacterium]|jgi:hypothetical protein
MPALPRTPDADAPTDSEAPDNHVLDVYLDGGKLVEVLLDGESVHPTWFKIEWKETGEVSAKVKGVRLATRFGDEINIHQRHRVPSSGKSF